MSFLGSVIINSLSYLKNAGFDPVVIRNDGYCNVLYYHADSASPVAWDVESQFPCSSNFSNFQECVQVKFNWFMCYKVWLCSLAGDNAWGGLTILWNLRILQRKACKKNKLEFLVGFPIGYLCEPVTVCFCFFKLRLQARFFFLLIFVVPIFFMDVIVGGWWYL